MDQARSVPHVLRRLSLKRVSLVDNPANQKAIVCFWKAEQSSESREDMTDAKFAAVWTDADGKKQRKLPIHDAAHVRNALARFNQTDMPASVKAKAKAKIEAAARRLGIGDYGDKEKSMADDVEKNGRPGHFPGDNDDDDQPKKQGELPVESRGKGDDDEEKGAKGGDKAMACKACKAEMPKYAGFCPHCGAETDEHKSAAKERKEKGDMDEDKKAGLEKGLSPEVAELIRKADARAAAAEGQAADAVARVAKMEDERLELGFVDLAKREFSRLSGKPETLGPILKRAAEKLSKEDNEELLRVLRAGNAAMKTTLSIVGSSEKRAGSGSASEEANALADAEIKKSAEGGSKLEKQDALAMVFKANRALYERYRREAYADAKNSQDEAEA